MIPSPIYTFTHGFCATVSRYGVGLLFVAAALLFASFAAADAAEFDDEGERVTQGAFSVASPTPPPEPPTLLAPQDDLFASGDTIPPLGVPRLLWSFVSGAERYRVQVSETTNFSDPIVNQITYMNSYTPKIALLNGDYYWRVQAEVDRAWGDYSDVRRFTKEWTGEGQIIPELLMPDSGSTIAVFAPSNFTWTAVAGTALYKFEISSDEDFSSLIYWADTVKPHHTPSERLPNNDYYWRVTPIDNQDQYGDPSGVSTFTFDWDHVTTLHAPADNSELPFMPQFSWAAVEAADTYLLELSTDPEFSAPQRYATHQTTWTAEKNLANDQEYYWRVQALDKVGNSGPWSPVRRFIMRWEFEAELLTPENNYAFLSYPVFQWAPIAGAERYQIQVDEGTSFDTPMLDINTHNVTAATMTQAQDATKYYDVDLFWRVRGVDAQDNYTPWGRTSSFRMTDEFGPNLIYPRYYYEPDRENLPQYMEASVGWPVFVWDAANNLRTDGKWGTTAPDFYELTVATDPAFQSVNFQAQTAGQAAVPTVDNPFVNPNDEALFYWRVRAYRGGVQRGTDMVWIAKIDDALHEATATDALTILFPQDRFEAVETPPLLGWLPVRDAVHYRVQISDAATFDSTSILEEGQPTSPNYAPWQAQAVGGMPQPMPVGAYWWRVQAVDAQNMPIGQWSEPRRFHISHNLVNGNIYDLNPPIYPASILSETAQFDPAIAHIATNPSPASDQYKIDNLHVMLNRVLITEDRLSIVNNNDRWSSYDWILAFEVSESVTDDVVYGLYIDSNHVEGNGATVDPLGKPIDVVSHYLPDYAIYATRRGNTITPSDVQIFRWTGSSWAPAKTLAVIGGDVWFDSSTSAFQLVLPYTAIGAGDSDFAGSTAFTAFSTSTDSSDGLRDTVPRQTSRIDNPTLVSDMPMPLTPFDSPLTSSTIHLQMPTMQWRLESYDSIDGYEVQIARDREFTDIVETATVHERGAVSQYSWLPAAFQTANPYPNNETYYWRVRVRHEYFQPQNRLAFDYSPWSMPMRFTLDSQQPGNPVLSAGQESVGNEENRTPAFSWERVEGVSGYVIQVDTSADFSRPVINEKVDGITYTPEKSLEDDTYYWRVAMRRSDKVIGRWTETMTFTKRSALPLLVSPAEGELVVGQPTFQWNALLAPEVDPAVATPRYQLQVAANADFSVNGLNLPKSYKLDSTSFTPTERDSLADGTWYWRVATLDAERHIGAYSETQSFEKVYPEPELVTTPGQTFVPGTVNFQWQPVDGAAYYEIQYDDSPVFELPRTIATDNVQYTPTEKLAVGTYYWRVRIVDADRNKGPYADSTISVSGSDLYLPLILRPE